MTKKIRTTLIITMLLCSITTVYSKGWLTTNGSKGITISNIGFYECGNDGTLIVRADKVDNIDNIIKGDHYTYKFKENMVDEEHEVKSIIAIATAGIMQGKKFMVLVDDNNQIIKFMIINK